MRRILTSFFLDNDNLKNSPGFGDNSLSPGCEARSCVCAGVWVAGFPCVYQRSAFLLERPWLSSALIIGSCHSRTGCIVYLQFFSRVYCLCMWSPGSCTQNSLPHQEVSLKGTASWQRPGWEQVGTSSQTFVIPWWELKPFPSSSLVCCFSMFGDSFLILI